MLDPNQTSQIQSALAAAQSIFIALPQKPNFDQVAAGLGLYLSLAKTKKSVEIGSDSKMTVEFSSLVGVNKVKDVFQGGKDSLTIAFDYIEDAIEKVSYNIEGGKFNLVVKPKSGHPPLDSEKVEYSYTGGKVDLIFTIGVTSLGILGKIYHDNREAFEDSQIVNLDHDSSNRRYGRINLVNPTAASISEETANLIAQLRLPADEDVGTNLLQGIERATRQFASPRVGSSTFEAAAFCLRIGGRKKAVRPMRKKRGRPPLRPMPPKVSAKKPPAEPEEEEEPKPDWLEPKIFKGEGRV
jgi:nanoRNase/pAp phosphatase (c-di-AMP/oligoRNAs hydrolase)